MMYNISEVAEAVLRMDEQLHNGLLKNEARIREKAMWKEKHKEQVDRLNRDGNSICDHIRAMVYSMLSAERPWEVIQDSKERIDTIFFDYDPKRLKAEPAENLEKQIRYIKCGNRRIKYQMKAIKDNVEKLESFEAESGSIDRYYKKLNEADELYKTLVAALAGRTCAGRHKLVELEVALVSEYLRNVGYPIPKPDRHVLRVLGSEYLACSINKKIKDLEVFDIIAEIAKETGKPAAEVDYILWTYCARGYGAVCAAKSPKCNICAAGNICNKQKRM